MMKKYLNFLIFILLLFPISVLASGSIKVNKYNVTLTPGSSESIKITASNATGVYRISSSNPSVASVDVNQDWVDNETKTFNIKGLSVGTTTISVSIDGSDYDEVEIITTYKIVVYVNNPTTTTTKTVEEKQTTTKSSTKITTASKNQTTLKTTAKTTTTTTTNIIEETTQIVEPTTELSSLSTPMLKNLKIVGYDIDFKSNQTNYKITIPSSLRELYLITEKDESITCNDGLIDITDKDYIVLTSIDNSSNEKKEYKIDLIRKDYKEQHKNYKNLVYTILIFVAFTLVVIAIIFTLRKMINNKKIKYQEPKEDELTFKNDYFE